MKRIIYLAPALLLGACGALATTETSYYVEAEPQAERACDGPPTGFGMMADQSSVRLFDDGALLCRYDASNQLVATFAQVGVNDATHEYTIVDDPVEAHPVHTFEPYSAE